MNIENRGEHPSLNTFYRLVTLLNISVDQFLRFLRHFKGIRLTASNAILRKIAYEAGIRSRISGIPHRPPAFWRSSRSVSVGSHL